MCNYGAEVAQLTSLQSISIAVFYFLHWRTSVFVVFLNTFCLIFLVYFKLHSFYFLHCLMCLYAACCVWGCFDLSLYLSKGCSRIHIISHKNQMLKSIYLDLSYRFIMLEFVVCHHINNRFNTGKLEVYDKILQLYVKALPLKSPCVPADFILPFISTMFRHRSPSSSAPCAASLTLAHISPFISPSFSNRAA